MSTNFFDLYDPADEPLGEGAFGEVYLCTKIGEKDSDKKMCVKYLDKSKVKTKGAGKYIKSEIAILKELDHPNIIKLYDSLEDDETHYIVMEFCNGGDVDKYLKKKLEKDGKGFSEEVAQHIMRQVISAMKYIHGKRILHRDLKLENIMINYDNEEDRKNENLLKANFKLIDFGLSRKLKVGEYATSNVGSLPYKAPQLIEDCMKNKKTRDCTIFAYDEKIDIWSLGVLFYEMLAGKWPFSGTSQDEIQKKIISGEFSLSTDLSKETINFINEMLKYDYEERANSEKLSKHPFLTKDIKDFTKINKNLLTKRIEGEKLKFASRGKKLTPSMFAIFGDEEEENVKKDIKDIINLSSIEEGEDEEKITMDEKEIMELFRKDFEIMNGTFISTDPKIIPAIPKFDEKTIFGF